MPDTLYENQTDGSGGHDSVFSNWWKFQTFTPSVAHQITSVDLYVHRTGSPGTILVEIYGVDGSSHPDVGGGVLASGSYDSSVLTDDGVAQWLNTLISGAGDALSSGIEYALVHRLQNTGASGSVSNHFVGGNPYAGGLSGRSINGGVSFSTFPNDDTTFKEYGVAPPPTKTFIAGASIAKDGVTKNFVAGASISQDGLTKTFTADVNTRARKQFTADASIFKSPVEKTIVAQAIISQDAVAKTFVADAHVFVVPDATWPEARPEAYDPSKVWDEENKSWYSPTSSIGVSRMAQAGGRLKQNLVVMSNQGKLYFGEA